MKEEVRRERKTFAEYAAEFAEKAKPGDEVNEKSLCKRLGIHRPTATKLLCAFDLAGYLGEQDRKGFVWLGDDKTAEVLAARAEELHQEYLPLVERDKDFDAIGYRGYLFGTLIPALKLGITFGSLSVIFLQRKMSVVRERAEEIYDLLGVGGFHGEDDQINTGRKMTAATHADFDRIYIRLESRK